MLDEVFGAQYFQNEIIWCYEIGGRSKLRWARKHDVILFYSKSSTFHFDPQGIVTPRQAGTHMKTTTGADGREYQEKRDAKSGKVYRYYIDEGTIPTDWWVGIQQINREAAERLGYPTQKPEALLDMIIQASSKPGDVVLDPFAGCGTSIVVAHRRKREWVGIDISPTACSLMRRRLQKVGALDVRLVGMPTTVADLHKLKPFEFQNWIVDRINGIQSSRRSGDMGVDGHTFFLHDPVQIKQSEAIGRNVIDNFETAVKRDGKKRGFVIAFSFGRGAHEEAARIRREGLDIQLVTVADLLDRLDEVLVQMGVTTPSGALPGFEALPMPTIDSGKHSADELIQSDKRGANE
jgi:hypothetical protein